MSATGTFISFASFVSFVSLHAIITFITSWSLNTMVRTKWHTYTNSSSTPSIRGIGVKKFENPCQFSFGEKYDSKQFQINLSIALPFKPFGPTFPVSPFRPGFPIAPLSPCSPATPRSPCGP